MPVFKNCGFCLFLVLFVSYGPRDGTQGLPHARQGPTTELHPSPPLFYLPVNDLLFLLGHFSTLIPGSAFDYIQMGSDKKKAQHFFPIYG
jgi:hypothetical protein